VVLDVGVVGLHGQVEGDHPAGVHDRALGVLVVDGGDHPAVLAGDALALALGGALGYRRPDHVVPPGPGEQPVTDDPVGRPSGRRRHQPVERPEQDRRVDAAEHRRADRGVDPVELPVIADALAVLRLQPGADGADQVGHPRDGPVGGDAEPVPVDRVRPGAEAEEDPSGRVPPGAADAGRVRVGGAGERVGDARPDQRPLRLQCHLGQGRVRLVVDELAAAERGDAGRLGGAGHLRSAPGQPVPPAR
jgi:hypothetical protein